MTEQQAPERLGRYEIIRELGKGAMGIVYEGADPRIGRRVAIKTARREILEVSGRADEMMARFLREAQAAGQLNHPNIITIYDCGEETGVAYIAMEFLEGADLQKLLDGRKRFSPGEVAEIGATIVRALAHAHQHGVVHRDVKPSNVIMLDSGVLKVADFGIAHVSDSSLTQEGTMIGTPHYMSPEQFMGMKIDGRSDLFSAGVIVYELLTGEKPFPGEALSTVMHSVIRVEPIPPRELNFAVPEALSGVVLKALRKDPNQRYQTGEEMAAALEEALKPAPDPAVTKLGANDEDLGEATIVAGKGGGQPTVAASTQPPGAGATVAESPGATVAAGPPATGDTAATSVSAAEGAAANAREAEAAPIAAPAAVPRRAAMIGAAAVVLLLVLGGLLWAMRGGQAGPENGVDNAAQASTADSPPGLENGAPETAPPEGNYFSGLTVHVWMIDDPLKLAEYSMADDDAMRQDAEFLAQVAQPGRARIVVRENHREGRELAIGQADASGAITLELERPAETIWLEAGAAGYQSFDIQLVAEEPGASPTYHATLVSAGL